VKLVSAPKGKVVLFFPIVWEGQFPLWAPTCMWAIGTALLHAGYEVVVIDERLDQDPRAQLARELDGALFVGISGKLGGQCKYMESAAQFVKQRRPDLPVVAGGWFPGLFPDQTITSPNIDIVVVGPGDEAIVQVADRLHEGHSMLGVENVYYKENGAIRKNPIGGLPRIEHTHPIPWKLFGMHRYVHPHGWVNSFTSRGCPGGCTFCAVICLDPRKWTALPPERVVDDMEAIVRDSGAEALQIMDTDFCASLSRVEKIARLILERGLKLRFNILGRYYTVRRMSDAQLWLLRQAGCNEIEIGLETGSQRISDQINKQCDVEDFPHLVRRLVRFGIRVRVNIILGFPDETRADLAATFGKMLELRELGIRAVRFQMFRFTPIPDAPDGRRVLAMTVREHAGREHYTYAELLDFPINESLDDLFWLTPQHERDVNRAYEFYAPLLFYKNALDTARGRPLWRLVLRLFQVSAAWRIRRAWFALPIEMWLNRMFGRRMPRGADEGISPAADQLPLPPPEMGQALDLLPSLPPAAEPVRAPVMTASSPS
jgi:radical SAM superfamily enzyme YgiQ (UPF0313 family)